ncbi:MAG: hypothetical protein WCO69_01895 [Candidatus Omnitrophota bacterium]
MTTVKLPAPLVTVSAILAAVILFFAAVTASESPNQKIFEFPPGSYSWVSVRETTFSFSSSREMLLLPSRDRWTDVRFDCVLVDPTVAGLAFDYQGQEHFSFFLIDRPRGVLEWGTVDHAHVTDWRSTALPAINEKGVVRLPLTLEVHQREAALMVNGQLVTRVLGGDFHGGKIALLIGASVPNRNGFMLNSIQGVLASGRTREIKARAYSDRREVPLFEIPGIPFILAFYSVLVFLGYRWVKFEGSLSVVSLWDRVYCAAGLLLGAVVFSRLWQVALHLGPVDIPTYGGLMATVGTVVLFILIAYSYSRLFAIATPLFLFVALPFFCYFLNLMNLLVLHLNDTLFIRLCVGALCLPLLWRARYLTGMLRAEIGKLSQVPIANGLILLWSAYAACYCFEYDLVPTRHAIIDEGSLWVTAAQHILADGMAKAQLLVYPGGGLHSFGISFVAALPGVLWGNGHGASVYLMPLFNIAALMLFLHRIKTWKWGFLFFFVSLFMAFDYTGIVSKLLYQLVYGEGISSVYFLVLCLEVFVLAKEAKELSLRRVLAVSMGIGLMALTKSPVGYFGCLFMLILSGLYGVGRWARGGGIILGAWFLFLAPITLWKGYTLLNGLYAAPVTQAAAVTGHSFNGEVLWRLWSSMISKGHMAWPFVYVTASCFMIARTFGKRDYVLLGPVFVLIVSVLLYYLFSFCADYDSSTRYFMPALLPLFFFGAVGFERWMGRLSAGRA